MIKDRREFLKTAATMAFAPMAFATNFDNLFSQININSLSELKTYLSEHINKVAQKMFVSDPTHKSCTIWIFTMKYLLRILHENGRILAEYSRLLPHNKCPES